MENEINTNDIEWLVFNGGAVSPTFQTKDSSVYSYFNSNYITIKELQFSVHMIIQERMIHDCNILINNKSYYCNLKSSEDFWLMFHDDNFNIFGNKFSGYWVKSAWAHIHILEKFHDLTEAVDFYLSKKDIIIHKSYKSISWRDAKALIDDGIFEIIGSNYGQINNQGEYRLEQGEKLFKRRHTAASVIFDLLAQKKS